MNTTDAINTLIHMEENNLEATTPYSAEWHYTQGRISGLRAAIQAVTAWT